LRKTAAAIALVLVASLGIIVPSVSAATGDPKVVIIVGATHGATAGYRADADVAYAEAIKYTSNVVKVYSPNATWARVKAEVAGASIVIYMGHGNGWPSPYGNDAAYTTKDGFGLNATAGAGDYNNTYYGEPAIATLGLAPGAIVLLHHLCYASGNSEPGNAEPTVTVARQRADNYASAFLKAGASAVIADGHAGAEGYLRQIFTTHQTIESMWRSMPNRNGNVVSFPSARRSGVTVFQDPLTPTSGFYRSMAIGWPGVTTDDIVSAGYKDTGGDPTSLVVPGNASVAAAGANVYGSLDGASAPSSTLPAGTRLRVVDHPTQTTALGPTLVQVQGLDDPTITGFVATGDLVPRDSAAPLVRTLYAGVGTFSPNGDGSGDQITLRGRFTEAVAWTLQVRDAAAAVLYQQTGAGSTFQLQWDGLVGGHPVPDGTYTVALTGVDAWGNAPAQATRTISVDTVAPTLTDLTPAATTVPWFSPNGDGVMDSVTFTATNPGSGSLLVRVLDAGSALVQTWSVPNGTAPAAVTWDGRTTAGGYAPDGVYTIRVAPVDDAGNAGTGVDRTVTLVGALRSLAASRSLFFPQDGDTLAPSTRFTFVLSRPMSVSWQIRDSSGRTVVTYLTGYALRAGTASWTFYGRGPGGTMLPRGHYTSVVTATDGTLTATQSVSFDIDAFLIRLSDTTPGRGQSITVTATTAEALARNPTLYVSQPGVARWVLHLAKVSSTTYRSTIRIKNAGRAGTVSFTVWGADVKGGSQATTKAFPLH
jgi:flagellar hook assembly protein FlgD